MPAWTQDDADKQILLIHAITVRLQLAATFAERGQCEKAKSELEQAHKRFHEATRGNEVR